MTFGRLRPTVAEIDLGAIRGNVTALRRLIGEDVALCAVVKADAYGHGDVPVARAALDAGASWLAVALVEEAVVLREAGIEAPIVVLVPPPPGSAEVIVRHALTPSVATRGCAEAIAEAAAAAGRPHPVHVCVDSGMHREGALPADAIDLAVFVANLPTLRLGGVWSHLAVADEAEHPSVAVQVEGFGGVLSALRREGVDPSLVHMANSAGAIAVPEARYDMVRCGISVYGLYPAPWLREHVDLRPAMRLVSSVASVRRVGPGEGVSYGHTWAPDRDTTLASVPIGYADGYPRPLSNRADVLIGGKRRRVAGRVTMDQIVVDCGDDDIAMGDEVVMIGRQGDEEITADELAGMLGTINYEIVSSLGARVPRVHVP